LGRTTVALIAALALALPAAAHAKGTRIPTAHVIVTVEPNGVIDVLESVTVSAEQAYDARQEVSMNAGELFAQPSVVVAERRLDAGEQATLDTFLISRGNRGVRISWRQPQGTRSVRLGYRLALLGIAYDDVVDVDVPLWERDWPGRVATLTGFFRLPRPAHGRVRAWIEGSYAGGVLERSRLDVRVRLHDVPAKEPLRLHVVFPRSVLSGTDGVVVRHGNGLRAILAARDRQPESSGWWWVLGAGLGTALFALVSAALLRRARSRPRPRH